MTKGSRTTSNIHVNDLFIKVSQTFKVNATPTRKLQSHPLVIESFPCMALALQESGWQCDSYHPRAMIESSAQQVGGMIRSGRYQFVWTMISSHPGIRKHRLCRLDQMSDAWLHLAGSCSMFAVHCRKVGKHMWSLEEPFVTGKFLTDHHLCHLGIRLVGTHSSSVVYRLLSTEDVPSHPCAHPGEQHALERHLPTGKLGTETQRHKAEVELCKRLLQEWMQK